MDVAWLEGTVRLYGELQKVYWDLGIVGVAWIPLVGRWCGAQLSLWSFRAVICTSSVGNKKWFGNRMYIRVTEN